MKVEELLRSLAKSSEMEKQAIPFVKKAVEEIGNVILRCVDEAAETDTTLSLIVSLVLSQQVFTNALKSHLQSSRLPLIMLQNKATGIDPKMLKILKEAMEKTLATKTSKIMSRTANLCKKSLEDGFDMFDLEDVGDKYEDKAQKGT